MKNIKNTNYYINEDGTVTHISGRIKTTYENNWGYLYVTLYNFVNKKSKSYNIHRLVGDYFISNPNNLREINHINGIKTDNRIENLEWVSSKSNKEHAKKLGLWNNDGSKNGMSKLTEDIVKEIKEKYIPRNKKYGCIALSQFYNISPAIISGIINNKLWTHV